MEQSPIFRAGLALDIGLGLCMSLSDLSPIISLAALVVSLLTAWFTVFRRGNVYSTRPSFIAIRYDFVANNPPQAKVFLRTLLFSSGKRGHVVESLFLRVRREGKTDEFAFWGHGDKELVRGSGLSVPEAGVVTNHHFNPIDAQKLYRFSGGTYELELCADIVSGSKRVTLWKVSVEVPSSAFESSIRRDTAVFFSWSPESKKYISTIEHREGPVHAISSPAEA